MSDIPKTNGTTTVPSPRSSLRVRFKRILDGFVTPLTPPIPSFQNVLVTGGAGYIGSHTVLSLLLTRKYRVATIDNYHNAFPTSLRRVEEIARQNLPKNPTPDDILSTKVQPFEADLTKEEQVRNVLSSFGQGGLWGVIHIAVRHVSFEFGKPDSIPGGCVQGLSRRPHFCHKRTFSLLYVVIRFMD